MPNPIYLPQRQNPWETIIPQIVGQLALSHIAYKRELALADRQLELRRIENEEKNAEFDRREKVKAEYQAVLKQVPAAKPVEDPVEARSAKILEAGGQPGVEFDPNVTPQKYQQRIARGVDGRLYYMPEPAKGYQWDMASMKQVPIPKDSGQNPLSDVGKLISDRQKYATGTPERSFLDSRIQKLIGPAASGDPEKAFTQASKLRGEFNSQSKVFVSVRDAYRRIKATAKDPSAAGDLSLIFAYMKMLDPGSTVREGEQATATNARGVPDAIRNWYNKVMYGEKLAPGQRQDFLRRSDELYVAQKKTHKDLEKEYARLAQQNGIKPSNVVVDYVGTDAVPEEEQQQGQQPAEFDYVPGKGLVPVTR